MAIVLALGTSLSYGLANLLAPLYARRFPLAAVLLAGQLAALTLAVIALGISGEALPTGHAVLLGVLAGAGNAMGLIGFLLAADAGPVSLAAPIGATGGALPVLYGLAQGDPLGALEAAGLVLALLGVVLVSRRPVDPDPEVASGEDLRACVGFALMSALGFGLLLILLPKASVDGRWWALVDARAVIVLAVLGFAAATGRSLRAPRARLAQLAIPGVLLLTGTLLYTLATERGSLSVVAVLASLNPAVTVGLAVVVLSERLARIQTIGIACIIFGVVAVAA
jgi:drug/metabolite transporter (DMT)-like permease